MFTSVPRPQIKVSQPKDRHARAGHGLGQIKFYYCCRLAEDSPRIALVRGFAALPLPVPALPVKSEPFRYFSAFDSRIFRNRSAISLR